MAQESNSLATKAQYESLLEDRPFKFEPEEVGYMERSDDAHCCCSCIHWFNNPARATNVCEILRLPDDGNIPAQARCRWWTPDGTWYPLVEEGK